MPWYRDCRPRSRRLHASVATSHRQIFGKASTQTNEVASSRRHHVCPPTSCQRRWIIDCVLNIKMLNFRFSKSVKNINIHWKWRCPSRVCLETIYTRLFSILQIAMPSRVCLGTIYNRFFSTSAVREAQSSQQYGGRLNAPLTHFYPPLRFRN